MKLSIKCHFPARINTGKTKFPAKKNEFKNNLSAALESTEIVDNQTAENKWDHLRKTLYDTAMLTYGKKEHRNEDWYEASLIDIEPVINTKRSALVRYKNCPSQTNLNLLRIARRDVQRTARRCANKFWVNLSKTSYKLMKLTISEPCM